MIESIPYVLTGVGIIVSILYYTSVLRNANKTQMMQLETRQAQMFLNIFTQSSSREKLIARTRLLQLEFNNYDEFMDVFDPNKDDMRNENWIAMDMIIAYYEGLGTMVKEGLIPIRYVALLQAGVTRQLWEKYAPYFEQVRVTWEQPRISSEWEYLYNELIKYMEEHPELAT